MNEYIYVATEINDKGKFSVILIPLKPYIFKKIIIHLFKDDLPLNYKFS